MNSAAVFVEPLLKLPAPRVRLSGRLNIVAIYDGFEDGIHVHEALDWLDLTLGPDLQVHHCALSFAMLGRLDIRAAAIHEAAEADVLMVAAPLDHTLPVQVKKWIERCFSEHHDGPTALVALHDEIPGQEASIRKLSRELLQISRRWQLEYISNREFDKRMNRDAIGELIRRPAEDFAAAYELISRTSEHHYGGLSE